jgi:hypothetical protein
MEKIGRLENRSPHIVIKTSKKHAPLQNIEKHGEERKKNIVRLDQIRTAKLAAQKLVQKLFLQVV